MQKQRKDSLSKQRKRSIWKHKNKRWKERDEAERRKTVYDYSTEKYWMHTKTKWIILRYIMQSNTWNHVSRRQIVIFYAVCMSTPSCICLKECVNLVKKGVCINDYGHFKIIPIEERLPMILIRVESTQWTSNIEIKGCLQQQKTSYSHKLFWIQSRAFQFFSHCNQNEWNIDVMYEEQLRNQIRKNINMCILLLLLLLRSFPSRKSFDSRFFERRWPNMSR